MTNRIQRELQRLSTSPCADEKPLGLGTVRFIAWSHGDAGGVLERAKSVLALLDNNAGKKLDESTWKMILPPWFVSRCARQLSGEEAELELARLSRLSPREQLNLEKEAAWSLSNWIYFFEAANRHWYWWDGTAIDSDIAVIAVEVDNWPFPWGSLDWLLRASGAYKVEAEE